MSLDCQNDDQDSVCVEIDLHEDKNIVTSEYFDDLIDKCESICTMLKCMKVDSAIVHAVKLNDEPEQTIDKDGITVYCVEYDVNVFGNASYDDKEDYEILDYLSSHHNDKNVKFFKKDAPKTEWHKLFYPVSACVSFMIKTVSDKKDDPLLNGISELDVKDLVYDFMS